MRTRLELDSTSRLRLFSRTGCWSFERWTDSSDVPTAATSEPAPRPTRLPPLEESVGATVRTADIVLGCTRIVCAPRARREAMRQLQPPPRLRALLALRVRLI